MFERKINRRQFIESATALAGGVALPAVFAGAAEKAAPKPPKRTAVDRVTLGGTKIKLSRLGLGTGSRGGSIQRNLGEDGFIKLLKYCIDSGVRYIDTADNYKIQPWIGKGIKGVDREKLFIQSKIWAKPEKPMVTIDRFRKELGVDYIDTVLVHCTQRANWTDDRKRVIDALRKAKQKGWVHGLGVSCHTLDALQQTPKQDWIDTVLVRFNPQGNTMDTPFAKDRRRRRSGPQSVPAVVEVVKKLVAARKGVIGMKIIGNGNFTDAREREKSIRFAMHSNLLDAVTIGFKNKAEVDEAIERMDRALATAPPKPAATQQPRQAATVGLAPSRQARGRLAG